MNRVIKKTTVSLLGTIVLLSACTTLDPYTHEEKTSSATKGALIGAASGIAIGLMTGDDAVERRQYALIGAGAGAIAGGSVGAYMDNQELALRKKLEGTGVSVTRDGDNITLVMPSNVTFATNSSDLRPEFFGVLDSVNLVLKQYDKTVIEVAGHTDSTGTEQYNQALSERRAGTVATYLVNRGVLEMRVITIGVGETRPVADNSTESGRAINRRVELTLVPVTQTQ
ncbi:MAG: OmpA family protein [Gammaproteobacteria bacterium]|nr:OmpA family protein [Gammaproteobacteria bacterium]